MQRRIRYPIQFGRSQLLFVARETNLCLPVEIVDVKRLAVASEGILRHLGFHARKPLFVILPNLCNTLRLFQLVKRLPLAPCKRRAKFDGVWCEKAAEARSVLVESPK